MFIKKYGYINFLYFFLVLPTSSLMSSVSAEEVIKVTETKSKVHFTCWIKPANSLFIYLESLYKRSFDKIGIEFSMSYQPDARSISAVEMNISDGDCIRTTDYLENNPKLKIIAVKVNVGDTPLAAWTHLSAFKIDSVKDFYGKNIVIGHSLGDRLVENYFDQEDKKIFKAIPTIDSALKMLRTKRIDVYIGPYSVVAEEIKKLGIENYIFHAGNIDQMNGYPYLALKNKIILEKFEKALREELTIDNSKSEESGKSLKVISN